MPHLFNTTYVLCPSTVSSPPTSIYMKRLRKSVLFQFPNTCYGIIFLTGTENSIRFSFVCILTLFESQDICERKGEMFLFKTKEHAKLPTVQTVRLKRQYSEDFSVTSSGFPSH